MDNKKKSKASGILTVIILVLAVILVFWLAGSGSNGKRIDWTSFENMMEAGEISDVYLSNGIGKVRRVDSNITDRNWPKNSDYYFEYVFSAQIERIYEFNDKINKANGKGLAANETADDYIAYKNFARISIESVPAKPSFLETLLPYVSVVIVLVIGILMFKMLSGKSSPAGGFGKSKAKLMDKSTVKFDDIAGAEEEKEETKEIVEFLKNPERFKNLGARIPKGILLVGPPGTGKTLLAKAVAGESNVPFYSISGSDFVELYVGVGASRVRDLFDTAKQHSPCIVFIDEIDAVGRQRGAGLGGGNDEREQTLNQLLVEMDGFESNTGIIVLAATNRADVLDPALLRPGRFDRQIMVYPPDVKGREGIIKIHAKNKPIDPEVNLTAIARLTSGFTGADIENFLNEAAILAARDGRLTITMEDITEGINKVVAGPQKKSQLITEEDKKVTAYHESGHAILSKLLNYGEQVHEVSIIPRGSAGGFTLNRPDNDNNYMFYNKLCDRITMTMGGRIAEELVFGDITPGASSDIDHATKIARRMVTEWGMSKNLGFINLGSSNEVFIGRDYQTQVNYSEKTASLIDEEIKAILDKCYKKGKDLLTKNRKILENMAQLLLLKETIYTEEVQAIVDGKDYRKVAEELDVKEKAAAEKNAERKKQAEEENLRKMQELKLKAAEALSNAGVITKQDLEIIKEETKKLNELEKAEKLATQQSNEKVESANAETKVEKVEQVKPKTSSKAKSTSAKKPTTKTSSTTKASKSSASGENKTTSPKTKAQTNKTTKKSESKKTNNNDQNKQG